MLEGESVMDAMAQAIVRKAEILLRWGAHEELEDLARRCEELARTDIQNGGAEVIARQ